MLHPTWHHFERSAYGYLVLLAGLENVSKYVLLLHSFINTHNAVSHPY